MKKLLWTVFPLLGGALVYKASALVERAVATNLPTGSVSYLGYASRLITVLLVISTKGLSVVAFPMMSKLFSEENMRAAGIVLSFSFKLSLLLLAPVAGLLVVLSVPIVELTFMRGSFDQSSAEATALALAMYSGVLLANGLASSCTAALFARRESHTVVLVGVSGAILNMVLDLTIAPLWGFAGLALAASLTAILNVIAFVVILNVRIGSPHYKELFSTFWRVSIASCVLGLVSYVVFYGFPFMQEINALVVKLSLASGLGVVAYALVLSAFYRKSLRIRQRVESVFVSSQ